MDPSSDNSSLSPPASSSAASPAPKRETLTSRAQRIIGRVLKVDDDSLAPKENSARGQKARKAPTRRREQVLQAQRTHRQRTQGYIRELEKEVLRLRDSETALKSENALLKAALKQNDLPLPDEPSPPSWRACPSPPIDTTILFPSSSSSGGNVSSAASVTIDLTELSVMEAEPWCSVTAAMEETRPFEVPSITIGQFIGYNQHTVPSTLRAGSVGNYGDSPALNPQAAIDFVLELERPCMGHVKHAHSQALHFPPLGGRPSPDFNHGPHHVFNTAATIISSGMSSDPFKQPFQVPTSSLEQLFQLSLSLNLGEDVTPVQIWANIRRISSNTRLDLVMLQSLKTEFVKYVRCNSFGTVIHRDIVSAVFGFFFPGEQFIPIWG